MNSKNLIFTFVVAMCLLISVVHSQQCSRVLMTCNEGCCAMSMLALTGECTSGLAGQPCGGMNSCKCAEGLDCKDRMCVAKTTTTTTTTTTTVQPTSETAETTTPLTVAPTEVTTAEVTAPTATPETST